MADQYLRDSSGRTLGSIKESGGKLYGYDSSGRSKGHYDPKSNNTYDSSGRNVGSGNLLSMLITQK